jgi:hypothetical protein
MRMPMSEIGGPVDDGGISVKDDPFALFHAWFAGDVASQRGQHRSAERPHGAAEERR